MTEYWKIATTAVKPGMQVKSEGYWWQLDEIVDNGHSTGTMMLRVRRVAAGSGLPTGSSQRLIWLPITKYGATVRPGTPRATSVQVGSWTRRVSLQPRWHRDPMPYTDAAGTRYSRLETASYRRIVTLAQEFENGAGS